MSTEKHLFTRLAALRALLFDMDGVVYVGKQPLPGVMNLLNYLDATGRGWMFVTNNATMTSQQFADKVAAMDIVAPPTHILGSSEATAFVAGGTDSTGLAVGQGARHGDGGAAYCLARPGLRAD